MLVCLSLSPVDDLYNICPIRFIWHLFAITRSSQVMNKIHLASFCNNPIITGNEASYKSAALTSEQKLHCATTAPETISSEFYGTLWSWTSKHAAYNCYHIRVTEYDYRYHESKFSTDLCFCRHRTCLFLQETFSSLIKPLTTLFMFWTCPRTTIFGLVDVRKTWALTPQPTHLPIRGWWNLYWLFATISVYYVLNILSFQHILSSVGVWW